MKSYDTYDVVKKILGDINPVGETHEDKRRFDNLQETIAIVRMLIYNIREVSVNKDSYKHSVREAGFKAQSFMNELGIEHGHAHTEADCKAQIDELIYSELEYELETLEKKIHRYMDDLKNEKH